MRFSDNMRFCPKYGDNMRFLPDNMRFFFKIAYYRRILSPKPIICDDNMRFFSKIAYYRRILSQPFSKLVILAFWIIFFQIKKKLEYLPKKYDF